MQNPSQPPIPPRVRAPQPGPQFGGPPGPSYGNPQPSRPDNTLRNVLLGCGCLLLLGGGALVTGAFLLVNTVKIAAVNIGANLATHSAIESIEESRLSDADKKQLRGRIEEVQRQMTEGKVTFAEITRFVTPIEESPIFAASTWQYVEEHYIKPSGLSPEEKAAGARTVQRVVRGLMEDKLNQYGLEDYLEDLAAAPPPEDPDDMNPVPAVSLRLKDKVTDEDLRKFLKDVQDEIEGEPIPDEPYSVNLTAEANKLIDRALVDMKKPVP